MKAAIVGCGGIAMVHAESLKQTAGAEMIAFADPKIEKAEQFAEKFGGHAYASLEELCAHEKPDVLHICTPHYLHVPMAVYGLSQGMHVFMEKPPVMTEEQLRELEEAVAYSEKRIGFCFQNRYNGSVQAAKELLESKKTGKIRGARGLVTWSRGEKYYTESGWRGMLATEGGGALINQSIHTLDLLGVFMGKPLWTDAVMANHHLKNVIEVEDTMEAFVRYENGSASFYATTAYCDDAAPIIEIACEQVTIRIEEPYVTFYWKDGRVEQPRLETKKALGKSYWGSGHTACIADFYDCLQTGRRFEQDLPGVLDTVRLMLAVYQSARRGTDITL